MRIDPSARAEIVAHATASSPEECCGLLVGRGDHIAMAIRARNLHASPTRFLLDPADHIAARRRAREEGRDILGFYHSHPRGAAFPSPTDIAEASYADAIHVIAGLEAQDWVVRAFTISAGAVIERPLQVETQKAST